MAMAVQHTEIFLRTALALLEESGQLLEEYFYAYRLAPEKKARELETKDDDSPLTKADKLCEEFLTSGINKAFPTHAVLGEELGLSHKAALQAEFLWVIDPIDGTKSFITGNPLFGSLLALLHHGSPILGIIDMPLLGASWWGARGQRSYRRDTKGKEILHTSACAELRLATGRSTSPDMFRGLRRQAFQDIQKELQFMLYGGDCFCYAQLAQGSVDIVIEDSLAAHDFLALVPIIEGAGGLIGDWQGRPLAIHSKGDVLASANSSLHKRALDIVSPLAAKEDLLL